MGITKAERVRKEREEREAAWKAEEERVRKLEATFEAIPDGPEKMALQEAMTDRIIDLYNNVKLAEGDTLLEFLPKPYAMQLLDWYFSDEGPPTFQEQLALNIQQRPEPK